MKERIFSGIQPTGHLHLGNYLSAIRQWVVLQEEYTCLFCIADQQQHLELTRDVAQRFNTLYGETFALPQPLIPPVGARIMGLDVPTQKMSKSVARPGHALDMWDPPEAIYAKLMGATTDSLREIRFDPDRPGIFNLLTLYELFTDSGRAEIEARFAGKGYADLKRELADVIIAALQPLQARYRELIADPAHLETLLTDGAMRVSPLATKTLTLAKERLGLG